MNGTEDSLVYRQPGAETTLIEGLKVDISSEELKAFLLDKADYHGKKAEAYAEQAKGVKNLQEEDEPESMRFSNSPSHSLRQSAESHARRFRFYAFLAQHVIPNATYRLTEQDMAFIEMYSRHG